jgi:Ser/Thr protein kinase RdoA (MazF antagonist)
MNDREAQTIAAAFALGRATGAAVPVARGEMGRVWRVDTDRGWFAVKELLEPMDEASAQADIAFQLAAIDTGVPMPRPILQPDGAALATVERPGGSTATFRAYTWMDLADPVLAAAPGVAATLLARLHALDLPADAPMDPWFCEPLGPDGWAALRDAVRAAAPPWLDAFERALPGAEAAEAIVVDAALDRLPVEALRRCHLDFNPENVLLDVSRRPVVLDWENSGSAPYEQELAHALLDFAAEPQVAAEFLRVYHEAGGPARITGRDSFAMALAVQGNLANAFARFGIAAEAEEDRARMADRIDELDRTLFTLEPIDRILDVVVG